MTEKKIGIVYHSDFAERNEPPYPKPTFFSFEHPIRIKSTMEYLKKNQIFENNSIVLLNPFEINDSILQLGHSNYYINSIKRLSKFGGSILGDENYLTAERRFIELI
jgi:acetoin utilization deacetylase AcuC-like enzyme